MSTEDALFRTLRRTADILLGQAVRDGAGEPDLDRLIDETLEAYRPILQLGEHAVPLRGRLRAYLTARLAEDRPRSE